MSICELVRRECAHSSASVCDARPIFDTLRGRPICGGRDRAAYEIAIRELASAVLRRIPRIIRRINCGSLRSQAGMRELTWSTRPGFRPCGHRRQRAAVLDARRRTIRDLLTAYRRRRPVCVDTGCVQWSRRNSGADERAEGIIRARRGSLGRHQYMKLHAVAGDPDRAESFCMAAGDRLATLRQSGVRAPI